MDGCYICFIMTFITNCVLQMEGFNVVCEGGRRPLHVAVTMRLEPLAESLVTRRHVVVDGRDGAGNTVT